MTSPAAPGLAAIRDPDRPARLLWAEHDALRLVSGRPVLSADYDLTGATAGELVVL
jgi:hypothetical protein